MPKPLSDLADSPRRAGGALAAGQGAAFELIGAPLCDVPVLISVPHAGRSYPQSLLAAMRDPGVGPLRLEDRLVDRLGESMAAATGAPLLVAHAPRAMLDLNRAPDDIDYDMLGEPAPSLAPVGGRARSGLGLVPRRLPGTGDIWRGRLERAELESRIEAVHRPYHACLGETLRAMRARWGAALLIDLHSMPPLGQLASLRGRRSAAAMPQIVLGDRFGQSCPGALAASAFAHFTQNGYLAAHNAPYAGGYVLDTHADPAHGLYALQLEICRASYLDEQLLEPGAGFAAMAAMLVGLVERLGREVAEMGGRAAVWPEAAE